MDLEEAIKVLDAAVYAKRKSHLKDVEVAILRGSWQGKNYYEIADDSGYTPTYLKQDIGPKLWKQVSEALGEKVSKTNFQSAVERRWRTASADGKKELSGQEKQFELVYEVDGQKPANGKYLSYSEEEPTGSRNNNFIGRQGAIADLNNLVKQGAKIILIQGEGGVGKSLLSWQYLNTQGFDIILDLWMAKETENITSAKSVVEEWLKRHFNQEPGVDFGVTLERLRQKLRDRSKKVGVLIDNLEPALDKDGRFIPEHRDYVELLRVLDDLAANSVTLITTRERLGESAVSFHDYRLHGLDLAAWEEFFNSRNINTNADNLKEVLQAMHRAYHGNAKAMHILSGAIQTDWEGDIEAYWDLNRKNLLVERDLVDLVVSQFNRLQELDPIAYKLLCRLGCYRYQDVRSLLVDGVLHLLWDVPELERRRVVKSLRDRSLLDFLKGEYWLHSVIRAEAIARLRASDEWEITNRKAAEFWTESVETIENVEDARKALEAYYHYRDLQEFDRACEVLFKQRHTSSGGTSQKEALNHSFARLGLVQGIISVITEVRNKISNEYYLTLLCGDLGGLYHRTGEIEKALNSYHESREKAINCQRSLPDIDNNEQIQFELKRRDIGVLYAIGAGKAALGENQAAIEYFQEAVKHNLGTQFHVFAILSWFALAVLYSDKYSGEYDRQKAFDLLNQAEQAYKQLPPILQNAWWVSTYRSLWSGIVYTNLGEYEKALENFNQTKSYCEATKDTQNIAKVLSGLATLYRNTKDFQKSLENHAEAIKILAGMGAKADLADAYYQMGLTYQKMGEIEKSKTQFQQAIQLYQQIAAPKQVAKVERVMRRTEAAEKG